MAEKVQQQTEIKDMMAIVDFDYQTKHIAKYQLFRADASLAEYFFLKELAVYKSIAPGEPVILL